LEKFDMSDEHVGLPSGTKIGEKYTLIRHVGESSLGDIYVASQQTDDGETHVRVELLTGQMEDESVGRFLQEVDLLSKLENPNILKTLDAGEDGGRYYLVTATAEDGCTLDEYMLQHSPLAEREAMELLVPIVDALQYVWETNKLLHRDLKPSNIFITGDQQAKLTGFGIAKSSEEGQSMNLTGAGFTIGTPEYMSPEQVHGAGDLDFRCDMYSLGIMLYEMVTGSLPFESIAPVQLMIMHANEPPELANERNPNVTQECAAVIDQMLAKDREDRYETWQDLGGAFQRIAARSGGSAKAAGGTGNKGCMGMMAIAAIVAIAAIIAAIV
jgi:serine/threonine protein kinase